jgi:hypothetical protein
MPASRIAWPACALQGASAPPGRAVPRRVRKGSPQEIRREGLKDLQEETSLTHACPPRSRDRPCSQRLVGPHPRMLLIQRRDAQAGQRRVEPRAPQSAQLWQARSTRGANHADAERRLSASSRRSLAQTSLRRLCHVRAGATWDASRFMAGPQGLVDPGRLLTLWRPYASVLTGVYLRGRRACLPGTRERRGGALRYEPR